MPANRRATSIPFYGNFNGRTIPAYRTFPSIYVTPQVSGHSLPWSISPVFFLPWVSPSSDTHPEQNLWLFQNMYLCSSQMSFGTQNFRPMCRLEHLRLLRTLFAEQPKQNTSPPILLHELGDTTIFILRFFFSCSGCPGTQAASPGGPPGGCHTAPGDTWKDISHILARFLFIPFINPCRAVVMTAYMIMRLCTASSLQRQGAGREPLPHLPPVYPKTSFRFLQVILTHIPASYR